MSAMTATQLAEGLYKDFAPISYMAKRAAQKLLDQRDEIVALKEQRDRAWRTLHTLGKEIGEDLEEMRRVVGE